MTTKKNQEEVDRRFMRRALALAARGRGRTRPNPMVGAVVVGHGKIVGEGFHPEAGKPHAEVFALREAGAKARGATMYVTLEPCSHTRKRTPPCAPALAQSGLRRVVVAMEDPNPDVSGSGIALLRKKGIVVRVGVMEREAKKLNEAYAHFVTAVRPFVTLKLAATLDGRVAAPDGSSRWISGERARTLVHRLRAEADAVLVGIGTVLADDPALTTRIKGKRDPLRIVLDGRLRVPLRSRLFHLDSNAPTVVAATSLASARKIRRIESLGGKVWVLPGRGGKVELSALMKRLAEEKVTSLLVEGGSRISGALLREGLVDRFLLFLSPKLMGGEDSRPLFSGKGARRLSEAIQLEDARVRRIGDDFLIEGVPRYPSSPR
ncbi:MAG TPA: bifunctional diaminohydroxyphosphoribosylaminopyrimidine deaminase/5-amino-6-(5-phosphoribosylamino)uracil reductase RibD [Nitrospiria bacterium]|nr:bifunctional diaminohydroxyphosphoribosylaminopyrimidine deaminase/5-amino-6-(5-phosphoribosylamino)uracil reductase RibD [Nitrospiria bacterium]